MPRVSFSLRTLLAIVVGMSVVLGYYGNQLLRERRIRAVQEQLAGKGVKIWSEDGVVELKLLSNRHNLVETDVNLLASVSPISRMTFMVESAASPAVVKRLLTLPGLKSVIISGELSNEELAELGKSHGLRGVELSFAKFDPQALHGLSTLPALESLTLDYCTCTGPLEISSGFSALTQLIFDTPQIGQGRVRNLPALESLNVGFGNEASEQEGHAVCCPHEYCETLKKIPIPVKRFGYVPCN